MTLPVWNVISVFLGMQESNDSMRNQVPFLELQSLKRTKPKHLLDDVLNRNVFHEIRKFFEQNDRRLAQPVNRFVVNANLSTPQLKTLYSKLIRMAKYKRKDAVKILLQVAGYDPPTDDLLSKEPLLPSPVFHRRRTFLTSEAWNLELLKTVKKQSNGTKAGKGGYGSVRKYMYNSKPVVVKTQLAYDSERARIRDEIEILRSLQFQNCVAKILAHSDLGTSGKASNVEIMMEYGGEDLFALLKRREKGDQVFEQVFSKVKDCLQCIHKSNIVHMDIKPENILIDIHNEPRLIDFGLSVKENERIKGGTVYYLSPNLVLKRGKTALKMYDFHSLAIVLLEFWFLRHTDKKEDPIGLLMLNHSHILPTQLKTLYDDLMSGAESLTLRQMRDHYRSDNLYAYCLRTKQEAVMNTRQIKR